MSIFDAINSTMAGQNLAALLQQYAGQPMQGQVPGLGNGMPGQTPTFNWYADYKQPTAVDLARPVAPPPGPVAAPALTPAQQRAYMDWEREGGRRPVFDNRGAGDGSPGPGGSFGGPSSGAPGAGGVGGVEGPSLGGFGFGGGGFGGLGIGGGLF